MPPPGTSCRAIADEQKTNFSIAPLLPYMRDAASQHDLKQPWDGPKNKPLLARRSNVLEDPTNPAVAADATVYRFFVGPNTLFPLPGQQAQYTVANIPDGSSNTILSVGAADGVPWSKPEELTYVPGIASKLGPPGRDYFLVSMCDGSVRMIKKTVSDQTLKNAVNPNDGNVLGSDW